MKKPVTDMPILPDSDDTISLFRPFIPQSAKDAVLDTLNSRWIGQGPKTTMLEERLSRRVGSNAIAVGSGTDALHLAYLLSDISPDDEVIAPVFTCTATNIPLLYLGCKIVFADVKPHSLNISPKDVRAKITSKTKAVVIVDYGGLPGDLEEIKSICLEFNLVLIQDAAHSLGASVGGVPVGALADFTIFSFQAIKHIGTGDGGALCIRDGELTQLAQRLRWFGIDRTQKQKGVWENDIVEIGYKYQMNDISASMALAGLDSLDFQLKHRADLRDRYLERLSEIETVKPLDYESDSATGAAWLMTVEAQDREEIQRVLLQNNIESGQVHYRNDRYSIFDKFKGDFPNMDAIEDNYLVLPLHMDMSVTEVDRVCDVIERIV